MYGIEQSGKLWHRNWAMAASPFQERISLLSSKAVSVDDPDEFNRVFAELRSALRGQLAHLREMVDEAKQTISHLPAKARVERRGVERRRADRRKAQRRGSR